MQLTDRNISVYTAVKTFRKYVKNFYQMSSKAQYTPPTPTRLNCRLESRRRCVRNSQLVGDARQSRRVWTNLPTAKSSCVVSRRREYTTHPSAVVTQFTISSTAELLRSVTSDDIKNDVIFEKKLSISIKMHVVKPLSSLVSFQTVGSHRELVANFFTPPTPTRLNSTVEWHRRRRCVGLLVANDGICK